MCGISGIWNYKTGAPADRDTLCRITEAIAHRGPDGHGYYFGPGPGLGHRRLAIIDLEGGTQPLCNEDGTVWIVFNGEIYNYPDLRRELLGRGHTLKTRSDTEAIVHLYEDYGEGCFEKLRGMFAIALWDTKKQTLILSRDRLGIKPLFYGIGEQGIVFGSELKCVRDSGQVPLRVDPTAIADLFTFYYLPGPKTIYKDVYSLRPGAFLKVTTEGVVEKKYWDLSGEVLELPSEQAYVDRLEEVLDESVRCHLLSDVPVGAFLSGGLDSSAVVALMSRAVTTPIMTCSIGFPEESYNELSRARAIADHFRTDHHELVVTPEPAKVMEQLVGNYDQPFPDHSAIPTYYVSKLARERVKVVLSGDGGDENFGGYSRYARHALLGRIREAIPELLLRPFAGAAGDRMHGALPWRLLRVAHQLAVGAREGYLHGITIADAALRARIFSPELKSELKDYDPLNQFRELYDQAPGEDPLSKIFYLDIKTYLVDDILQKVDRASMAHSLEVRVPLLDHQVVEFAYSLPLALKLRDGSGKYILKRAVERHLPDGHANLPKKGFNMPMQPWMQGALRGWSENILLNTSTPYLNPAGIGQVWNEFQKGSTHLKDILAVLLNYQLSARLWCTNQNGRTANAVRTAGSIG